MNRGVIGILSVVLALCFVTLGWGAELMKVSLVDLSDRDAVILEVDGAALVSDLVVHKLQPNRLEAYYQHQGEPAAVPEVSVRVGDGAPEPIDAWAGPWPLEERWWDPGRHRRLFWRPCWSHRRAGCGDRAGGAPPDVSHWR